MGTGFFVANIFAACNNQNLFKNIGFHAGILFTHYSNGRVKSPNSGINTYLLNVGLNYNLDENFVRKVDTTTVVKDYKSPKVKLLNLDNKVIATFKNTNIASKLTGIPESTIANQISSKYDNVGWTDRGLLFRSND